ncbi:MAG: Holliday junction resolvase RuvX [Candidatus Aminicenantia bacterium]
MRVLGIDFGLRFIGLAISDELGIIAKPLGKYERRDEKADKEFFSSLIQKWGIKEIVIGNPLHMDGRISESSRKCQEFAEWFKENFSLEPILWDERLTTVQAERILKDSGMKWRKRKEVLDKLSAIIILQSYLDSRRA